MNSLAHYLLRFAAVLLPCALMAARADEVPVAVAANFTAPMRLLAAEFERSSGHRLQLAIGSTGKFYAQIKAGAPFEVLLAADDETPARLVAEDAAVAGSSFTYAVGRLVLWSPKPGVVDGQGLVLKSPNAPGPLALPNPKLAPYGAAAVEVLKALGAQEAWSSRLVTAENLTQAQQFVASGNAAMGFLALSQVLKEGRIEGSAWTVPTTLHTPLRQDAVLLKPGLGRPGALALLQYLQSDAARALIQSHGYALK